MRTTARLGWIVALGGVLFCTAARADLIDPATLHIGPGAGTSCATGGCPLYGGEVNAITAGTLDIYQTSNGGGTLLTDPVLLILAVPNPPSGLDMSGAITGVSLIAPYPGGTTTTGISYKFGTTSYNINDPTGFAGVMSSAKPNDVYGFLGGDATGGDNSNSFTNLSGWDSAVLGITGITGFGIYVYELQTANFDANDLLNVSLSGIPLGTFAAAFGEDGKGKIFDNAFTEAGLETISPPHPRQSIPEPSTLALFGALLLALAGVRTRLRRA